MRQSCHCSLYFPLHRMKKSKRGMKTSKAEILNAGIPSSDQQFPKPKNSKGSVKQVGMALPGENLIELLREKEALKKQLERLHVIAKFYSDRPAVAAYLKKYNVQLSNDKELHSKFGCN